ncbi:MAG: hypothetical protein GY841_21910 [FCB group bacterium]|nr:hypothetical protein [FCB group bacterium]
MKKSSLAILLIFTCATLGLASEIAFVESYDQALKTAADNGQNILITFWSDT